MQVLVNFNAEDQVECLGPEPRGEFLTIRLDYSRIRDPLTGEQLARFSQSRGRYIGSHNFPHPRGQLPAGVTSPTAHLKNPLIGLAERGKGGQEYFGSARRPALGVRRGK